MKLSWLLLGLLAQLLTGCENKAATADSANCRQLRVGDSLGRVLGVMGAPVSQRVPSHLPRKLFFNDHTPKLDGTPFPGDGPVAVDLEHDGHGYRASALNCDAVWQGAA
jgi:hypothetical protein